MKFYEKNLEDLIWEKLQTDEGFSDLVGRGFPIFEQIDSRFDVIYADYLRQPSLGEFGIPDIICIIISKSKSGFGYTLHVYVIELKARAINNMDYLQLNKYLMSIQRFYDKVFFRDDFNLNIKGWLIGKDMHEYENKQQDISIPWRLYHDIETWTFNYDFNNGIYFEEVDLRELFPKAEISIFDQIHKEIEGLEHIKSIFYQYDENGNKVQFDHNSIRRKNNNNNSGLPTNWARL